MSREIVAPGALAPEQFGLLVLHRHVPERSLSELLTASSRVNDPVRRALFHLQGCDTCTEAVLCERGARLAAACAGFASGRARHEAAV